MDAVRAKGWLPTFRVAITHIAELGCSGGHSLAELGSETLQRLRWHAQDLESRIAQTYSQPRVTGRAGCASIRVHGRVQTAEQFPARPRVLDLKEKIGADVG